MTTTREKVMMDVQQMQELLKQPEPRRLRQSPWTRRSSRSKRVRAIKKWKRAKALKELVDIGSEYILSRLRWPSAQEVTIDKLKDL